jgi:hypothetical protein
MLSKKFFQKDIYISFIWLLLPVINWAIDFPKGRYNNYKIFSSMFWHMRDYKNLYMSYPADHGDYFLYGPVFSILIAPFALLPDVIGMMLWGVANVAILIYAINRLRLKTEIKILLMLLSTIELGNSVWAQQFNPSVMALILLGYVMIEEKRDFYSPLWILLGAFIKLYGIVGLIFFIFSKQKGKFILGCIVWSILLFIAPMIFCSPAYILQTYVDWYHCLIWRNGQLIDSLYSNQTIMGVVGMVIGIKVIPNFVFILIGSVVLLLPLFKVKQYVSRYFRMLMLASTLMFVILFSPASEHQTFVVCVMGLFLWMVLQPEIFSLKNKFIVFFILIFVGLGPTYIFSEQVALFILLYKLKGLPCIIVWGMLSWDLLTKNFTDQDELERFTTI